MKNRSLSYDFIRTISTIGILIAHYQYYVSAFVIGDGALLFPWYFVSCDFTSISVSCFFVLSGASLMYSVLQQEEKTFNLKSYYLKRVKSIYPSFYCVWLISYIFYRFNGNPVCTEPWKIIYTILGIDGWAGQFSGTNYYLTGEWFLGTMIFLYLLFPIYLKLQQKSIPLLLCLVTALFFIGMQCGNIGLNFYESALVRSVEFVFGMLFTKFVSPPPGHMPPPCTHIQICIAALATCVLGVFMRWVIEIHVMGQIILSGIAAFIVLYYMGIYAMKIPLVAKYAKAFSAISFPFYLLHHTILALTSSPFFGNEACSTPRKYYILFTAFCTTVFAACVVKMFVSWIVRQGTAVLTGNGKIWKRDRNGEGVH